MLMPTEVQRVRILVHHAWDLRDAGQDDRAIVQNLVDEGVPVDIARTVPELIDEQLPQLIHDNAARRAILHEVAAAVEEEDFEELRQAMLNGVSDDRTLQLMYRKLSELLLSDSHEKGTVAAYGLAFLVGLGDWPLIQALSHTDENVRFRSAFALGKMGAAASNAIVPLEKATSDPDDYVRVAAADALAAIKKALKPWWKFW